MIIHEAYSETLTRTYSDAGVYIHGGEPEGDYTEAIDPTELITGGQRTYTETDIPIEDEDAGPEDYEHALEEMGVDLT